MTKLPPHDAGVGSPMLAPGAVLKLGAKAAESDRYLRGCVGGGPAQIKVIMRRTPRLGREPLR